MEQITVRELAKLCMAQLEIGNGDRKIVISDDNEGNGYHGLFYGFTAIAEGKGDFYPIYDSEEEDISKLLILG